MCRVHDYYIAFYLNIVTSFVNLVFLVTAVWVFNNDFYSLCFSLVCSNTYNTYGNKYLSFLWVSTLHTYWKRFQCKRSCSDVKIRGKSAHLNFYVKISYCNGITSDYNEINCIFKDSVCWKFLDYFLGNFTYHSLFFFMHLLLTHNSKYNRLVSSYLQFELHAA